MRLFSLFSFVSLSLLAENWPGWRGPNGDGISSEINVPIKWSRTENIVWKTAIPGKGHSSPIVWEDRVFLTTCLSDRKDRLLICLDRNNGKANMQQQWQVQTAGHIKRFVITA